MKDNSCLMLPAQHRNTRRTQSKELRRVRRKTHPARSEYSENMTVREQSRISIELKNSLDNGTRPRSYLLNRLAARNAIAKQRPVRPLTMDISGAASLIRAIIPFAQVGVDLRGFAQPGEFTCTPRTLQRTAEHQREVLSRQLWLQ